MRTVPSDYFKHVSIGAFALLPFTWILLPVAGFAPEIAETVEMTVGTCPIPV